MVTIQALPLKYGPTTPPALIARAAATGSDPGRLLLAFGHAEAQLPTHSLYSTAIMVTMAAHSS